LPPLSVAFPATDLIKGHFRASKYEPLFSAQQKEFNYFSNSYKKLDYIHQNPVRAGKVKNPEDFLYSSAIDYPGIP